MAGRPSQRFIHNLRMLIADQQTSQVTIAKALKKSQAWVSQLINGDRDTPTRNVEAIARALMVPVERLWLPDTRHRERAPPDARQDIVVLAERCANLNTDGVRKLIEDAEWMAETARYAVRAVEPESSGKKKGA